MMKYANIQLGGVHGGAKLQQQQEGAEMFRTLAIPQSLDTPGTINTVENLAVTLRDYLVSLPVKGGERLYEANIAKELGVSRPMVRDACRVLEGEGLLVYTPNKGYSLRPLTRTEILHLVEFRVLLEEAAFGAAARKADRSELIENLHRACDEMEERSAKDDTAGQISADLAFHRLVVESTSNPWLIESFDRMSTQFRYAIRLMSRSQQDFKIYAPSHDVLIACIAKGDETNARTEIRRHISAFIPSLVRRMGD